MTTQEQRDWVKAQMNGREVVLYKNGNGKKAEVVYKYSNKGKGQLWEAVIIEGKQGYENHVLGKHPKKACYPGLADIETYGLTPQGMGWEI